MGEQRMTFSSELHPALRITFIDEGIDLFMGMKIRT
jgi:hypothetical protein